MTRWRIGLVLVIIVAIAALTGCYTVLRHPTGSEVVEAGGYYKSCADCHANAAYYHPYYSYGRSHSWWSGYYGSPWWYDDYWWWDPYHGDDGDYEGPEVEQGERHLWSPGGWATKGWGFTRPESGVRSEPPRSRPPGTSISQPAEEPKKEEKKEEKKETTEERSLWRSGKKGE